jgi:hypothetical protein
MKGSLLTSDIEKDKANEISEIIFQALQEIDPAEFKDEDSGGPGGHQALLIKFQNALYSRAHLSTNPLRRVFSYLTVLYECG